MKYNFTILSLDKEIDLQYRIESRDNIDYIYFEIKSETIRIFPEVELRIDDFDLLDTHFMWQATAYREKHFEICWGDEDRGEFIKGTLSAPIAQLASNNSRNRLTVAYSEVLETIQFKPGIKEEDATGVIKFRLFVSEEKARNKFSGVLRIDTRDIRMEDSIRECAMWYEDKGYKVMQVPESAKEPMYSTWYSYHQKFTAEEIEIECLKAKALGCKAVIVDDGWQTEDGNRGYAYTGDWEVCVNKMGSMKEHVGRVHDMGMKYLLWYSVPFVGVYAKVWERFQDKLLYKLPELKCGVLDPRYREVRDYLVETYKKALLEWDLDGFKLDFIDEFDIQRAQGKALEDDKNRDFSSVQEAVEALLRSIRDELQNIKADIMLEFRQKYIGPFVRQFGNILRVADCPMDYIANRNGIVDLRLFSGETAVHSDMIMWNYNDTTESAALQFINILFGVPQISIKLEKIPDEHYKMLSHYMKFWQENKELLLNGKLYTKSMDCNNLAISSIKDNKNITAIYSDTVFELDHEYNEIILINGKLTENLIIKMNKEMIYKYESFDCKGEITGEGLVGTELAILEVKKSGYVKLGIQG